MHAKHFFIFTEGHLISGLLGLTLGLLGTVTAATAAERNQKATAAREVTVVARSFEFDPSRVHASPGELIEVNLTNASDVPHNIEFELPQGEVELESPVEPGRAGTLRFRAPKNEGSYVYYCPVGNHKERGMKGTLVVSANGHEPAGASRADFDEEQSSGSMQRDAGPPKRLYGTWVAEDVPAKIGEVKIQVTFRKDGPVGILAWSELPLVGQVREIREPYRVEGNTITSKAIRDGTQVQYWFEGDKLVIQYKDGKRVRFRKAG